MNLINFEKQTVSNDKWFTVNDYRKVDHEKTYDIIRNMLGNITKILPNQFKGTLTVQDEISSYLGEKGSYFENLKINMSVDMYEREINLKYPMLLKGNYFIMNGSMYIPILFLERSPIDILKDSKKGTLIFINLMPTFNITINVDKNEILIKRKILDLNTFIYCLFEDDPEYLESISDTIEPSILSKTEMKKEVIKLLGFHDDKYFENNNLSISEFFDKYIILDYFKEMFIDKFGISSIKDIIKLTIKHYIDDVEINMSDINNRRVVMSEYLITPVYEMYLRLLFGAMDKNDKQAFLPTMNSRVILTSGFQKLMHGGVYFNTSLPYINPIINKISQDIYIISEGRIPKSWSANHPNAIGKLCPISVSAQQMGKNLIFTNDTRINKYGRVEQ